MNQYRRKISVRETLLVVGEGDAEIAFVRLVRSCYTQGRVGRSISHQNAHGYGAANVIDIAISRKKRDSFTAVAAMVDADTDWNEAIKARARRAGIIVVCSDPCLEASLLRIVGIEVDGDQRACKEAFRQKFGGEAHADGLISRYFDPDVLNASRNRVQFIDDLLVAIGI